MITYIYSFRSTYVPVVIKESTLKILCIIKYFCCKWFHFILRMIAGAHGFVSNQSTPEDLTIPFISKVIKTGSLPLYSASNSSINKNKRLQ